MSFSMSIITNGSFKEDDIVSEIGKGILIGQSTYFWMKDGAEEDKVAVAVCVIGKSIIFLGCR